MSHKRPLEDIIEELTHQLLQLQGEIADIRATQSQFQMVIEHLLGVLPEDEREKVLRLFTIYSNQLPNQKG